MFGAKLVKEVAGRTSFAAAEFFEALADTFASVCQSGNVEQTLIGCGFLQNDLRLSIDSEGDRPVVGLELLKDGGGVVAEAVRDWVSWIVSGIVHLAPKVYRRWKLSRRGWHWERLSLRGDRVGSGRLRGLLLHRPGVDLG